MPECCLWEPGELGDPLLCWGSCALVGRKGENHFFPVCFAPFIKFTLPWPDGVSSINHVPATSHVHCYSWPHCPRCEGIPAQDTAAGGPHPAALADGSLYSAELSLSPETAARQDLPLADEHAWASPAGSILFLLCFPKFIPFVLLFLPQPLRLPAPFLKISPSLLLVGASEFTLLFFFSFVF